MRVTWRRGMAAGLTAALSVALVLTAAAARRQSTGEDPLTQARRAVITGDAAYVALPPDLVTEGPFERVLPSPTGAHLLIERAAPPKAPVPKSVMLEKVPTMPERIETSILLWNVARRRGTSVFRGAVTPRASSMAVVDGWFAGTDVALVRSGEAEAPPNGAFGRREDPLPPGTQIRVRLVRIDAATGATRTIAVLDDQQDEVLFSPNKPVAAVESATEHTIRVIRLDGTVGRVLNASDRDISWMGWRDDGKTLYGMVIRRRPAPATPPADGTPPPRPQISTALLDTETGTVTYKEGRPNFRGSRPGDVPETAKPPLRLVTPETTVKQGDGTATVRPLWLEGTAPEAQGRALIAADADRPLLLPGAVVYRSQGVLFAAPLVRMERGAFLDARQKAYKAATIQRAKQVGLALIMYAQDYDENFPPPGSDPDLVQPYLKSRDAFNNPETGQPGLQLAYKQSSLVALEKPAVDVLGYLSGPGGRAVIYVDGHVKWEDFPPKP